MKILGILFKFHYNLDKMRVEVNRKMNEWMSWCLWWHWRWEVEKDNDFKGNASRKLNISGANKIFVMMRLVKDGEWCSEQNISEK